MSQSMTTETVKLEITRYGEECLYEMSCIKLLVKTLALQTAYCIHFKTFVEYS